MVNNATIKLVRAASTDQGTPGWVYTPRGVFRSMELPWRNNERQRSCIPTGAYKCEWKKSPKFGWCYHVLGVRSRGDILIHAGNLAGDTVLGFRTHSHGCILPAARIGKIDGQTAGLLSAPTVNKIASIMGRKPFLLEVTNA